MTNIFSLDFARKTMSNIIKKIRSSFIVLVSLLSITTCNADDKISIGAGIGGMYNGLGANVSFIHESDLQFVSLGCIAIGYGTIGGFSSNCGIGAGWIKSDIISDSDKHAIGINIGLNYNTHLYTNHAEAFIGFPYIYFFKGMTSSGWNIGLTPIIGKYNDNRNEDGIGRLIIINLGYQF